ncbi:hypothetical protein Tco_0076782, partial [Tanacetum coccineum]
MNEDYCHERNSCYDPNSFGFDQLLHQPLPIIDPTPLEKDQAAKDRYWKIPICYDDDEDEESSIPLKDVIISGLPPCVVITPVLLTEEPVNSLSMGDEHLDTIPATELDKVIKSSVENLVPIPSEFEGISEDTYDVPVCEDPSIFDALNDHSEILSDSNDDGTSSD